MIFVDKKGKILSSFFKFHNPPCLIDRDSINCLVFERETDLVPVGVHNLSSSIKTKETRNKTCSFSKIFNFCLRLKFLLVKLYKSVNFVAFQTCK